MTKERALLDRAVDVMSALHRAIEPMEDDPELAGRVPPRAMREFVDALADIDGERCRLPAEPSHKPDCASLREHRPMPCDCAEPRGDAPTCIETGIDRFAERGRERDFTPEQIAAFNREALKCVSIGCSNPLAHGNSFLCDAHAKQAEASMGGNR